MKKLLIPILISVFALFSCELVPDLNPSTSSGSPITVATVNDILITDNVLQDRNYDIDGDGLYDLKFEYNFLDMGYQYLTWANLHIIDGTILVGSETSVYYGTQLSIAPVLGAWIPYGVELKSSIDVKYNIPNGKRYIFYKKIINNKEHFGWIEFRTSTAFPQPGPTNGFQNSTITRIAIAEEPGVVLRAGQTE